MARLWLDKLCQACPTWSRSALEPLALEALADLYHFLDNLAHIPIFDFGTLLEANIAPTHVSLADTARIFIHLRGALRSALVGNEPMVQMMVLERLDLWTEQVIAHHVNGDAINGLKGRQKDVAEQVASLNMLNFCAATLNATLDAVSAFRSAVELARSLTNADVCVIYLLQGGYFVPKAFSGPPQINELPIEFTSPDQLAQIIVDRQRKDIAIERVREYLGINTAQAVLCTPMRAGNETIGKITAAYVQPQRFLPQFVKLWEIFANYVGQAVHNALLYERLHELTVAQERQRIACEMHDTMLQTLVSLNINLQVALQQVCQQNWGQVAQLIEDARRLGKAAMDEGRKTLNSLNLGAPAHEDLVETIQPELTLFAEQSQIVPKVTIRGQDSLCVPPDVGHHMRRLLGEALSNIRRHAQATRVAVLIESHHDALSLLIKDNGIGFTPGAVDPQRSFGIVGMQERSRFINAQFNIESAPGQGTTVRIDLPRHGGQP